MFITQRQELAIRLLYFFLPWPLSKLLPPNLGRLFFGPGGLPSSYFLDSLPFSIDTPGQDQTVPIYPPESPVLIPAPSETTPVAVLTRPSPGLAQPSAPQLPAITPDPISSIPRYESVPAKVIPTSFTPSSSKSPIKPSTFVSSRGRGGSISSMIFMPLPGTPGKVSDIPFTQSLPKISPQKSLFSSSRGRGGSVSTSIFMPLPGRKLAPASVSIKQPLPYQAGNKSLQTTLIKSISYKNTTPRMQRLLSMSNRHVSINPTQGLSMQQSSFVSGHSYTNLVRAFKPQASFPFGHTGGARGGSYSISYFGNLMPFGVSIFDTYKRIQLRASAGSACGAGFNAASKTAAVTLMDSGCGAVTSANNSYQGVRGLSGISSGKYYFGFKFEHLTGTNCHVGISTTGHVLTAHPGGDLASYAYRSSGYTINNWVQHNYTTPLADQIIIVALNMDNFELWFGRSDGWFGAGDPATRANPDWASIPVGTWFATASLYNYTAPDGDYIKLLTRAADLPLACPAGYALLP